MSDIVKFEWDQPVEVALKYPDPKMFESQWGGERAMYSLIDGRVMYVDSLGAARITSLGVQPGELFFVVKRKNGRLTDFVAFREGQEPPAKDNRWSAPAGPAKKPAYKPRRTWWRTWRRATPRRMANRRTWSGNWRSRSTWRNARSSKRSSMQHIDAPAANGNGPSRTQLPAFRRRPPRFRWTGR